MLEKVFDSRDLRASDRVAAFREITANTVVTTEISIERPSEFRASLHAADWGEVKVAAPTHAALRSRRTARLVRQSDPEMYTVALVLCGQIATLTDQREATCRTGDLVVMSTSRPFGSAVDSPHGTPASVVVQIPRTLVTVSSHRVDRILATRMPGGEGVGGLLAGFLRQVATDTTPYRPADRHRLGGVLVDLFTAWLAHHVDAVEQTPAEIRQHVQFLRIRDFIHRHLGDPTLSPATLAAAHHISPRTVHRLFQQHADGTTVASYIRHQRLARARRDLAEPRLATRPIHAIATRWGFPRPPDFTRAFRARYGTTPSDYRGQAGDSAADAAAGRTP